MACGCEVRIADLDERAARQRARQAIDEIRRIEHKYSRYRADSVVGAINLAAGAAPVRCDDETLSLVAYADALHGTSDGLFDITSGVLRRAWDFKRARIPSAAEIDAALSLVGWGRFERDGRQVRLARAGMEIDFGGFGKEYAADRAATLLMDAGCRHGFVNLGGDLRAFGPQPDGSAWRIGIQHPRKANETIASLDVVRGALATSGDYERYFELDGLRYCHILDPRTGWPVRHWRSVTVLAPLAIAAGSLSTIAMLKEAAAAELLARSGAAWLTVGPSGQVDSSEGLAGRLPATASRDDPR
ncbi:MAG: FAD:protein FMN transferase [Burkholderiales bacterium]|nr:MAG: FAD:protein FMN transferase [Burkholderiales bacterium]